MGKLYQLATARNPNLEIVMFNCWWQDDYVAIYKEMLPSRMKICVWYYASLSVGRTMEPPGLVRSQDPKWLPYHSWGDPDFRNWPVWEWTQRFGSDRVLYMPSGVVFGYPQDPWQQMTRHIRTDRSISIAEALGVESCVFFDGWDLGTERDRLVTLFSPSIQLRATS